jgi:hypothetical protein
LEVALAKLILLSKGSDTDRHVVFVHGVRRANAKVWMSSGKRPELWPRWFAADIDKLGIWSVEHDSAPTLWRGNAMPLVDRANNILPLFLSEERLKQGDISFVVHSFGGLIFEQLLRIASDRSAAEQNVADFVKRISRVTFLGTPHSGADLATWAGRLGLLARPSSATQGLARNDPNLRELNQWYRRYAPQNGIATQTLTETKSTRFGLVVKASLARPGKAVDALAIPAASRLGVAVDPPNPVASGARQDDGDLPVEVHGRHGRYLPHRRPATVARRRCQLGKEAIHNTLRSTAGAAQSPGADLQAGVMGQCAGRCVVPVPNQDKRRGPQEAPDLVIIADQHRIGEAELLDAVGYTIGR